MKQIWNVYGGWLLYVAAILIVTAVVAARAEAAEPEPKPAAIVFPDFPVTPEPPAPKPTPPPHDSVPVLVPGHLYVIQSSVHLKVESYPREQLSIEFLDGPVSVYGTFAFGTGKVESRKYKSTFVVIVQASEGATGRAELRVEPTVNDDPAMITRQLLDIGAGPRPPPDPIVDPVVTAKALWIVNIDDAPKRTPALAALLTDIPFWDSFRAQGHQYSHMDKTNPLARPFDDAVLKPDPVTKAPPVGYPATIIMDAATKKILVTVRTPDKAGVNALVKLHSGK